MATEDKSSTIWSTFIQRPETLYKTRAIRFRDESRQLFLKALDLKDGMSILEIGCGPGAFCHALKRWLPNSKITGLDRDSAFIEYAIEKSRELDSKCDFIIGDATKLKFPDNTFEATISHTVIEHVETTKFLTEQYRVLSPGGILSELSVRTGIPANSEPWKNVSEEEKTFWDKLGPYFKASEQKYGVAGYSISETELPKRMMETGLRDISIDFLVQTVIPNNPDVSPTLTKAMIEANRQLALDGVILGQALAPNVLSNGEIERLRWLINSRFDQRIHLYESGEKVWDVSASVILIARGYK